MSLRKYQQKRDFTRTSEPEGASAKAKKRAARLRFVVQKHDASRLHYDLRLEMDGVLKSWAVPKGPSLDPDEKVLAVEVEDHPIEYGGFEGTIPKGEYGGGTVMLWDRGTWRMETDEAPMSAHRAGKIKFSLTGTKLKGAWTLVRMRGRGRSDKNNWLLIKERDRSAREGGAYDVRDAEPLSVKTGRDMDAIAKGAKASARKSTSVVSAPRRSRSRSQPEAEPPVAGAVQRVQPKSLSPQLALLVDEVPREEGWLHEVKFDGYRVLSFIEDGNVRLLTRKGIDWTHRFPVVQQAVEAMRARSGVLDGEIVVLNEQGISEFGLLQAALTDGAHERMSYFVFDVPYWDGWDLTRSRLDDRQALLGRILRGAKGRGRRKPVLRMSEHIEGRGLNVLRQACRLHLEGIVSKLAESPYETRRSSHWRKVKCGSRQEMVVGGYTDPKNTREGFGSLLLGYFVEGDRFVYAGRVGAGFTVEELKLMIARLRRSELAEPAYDPAPTGPDVRGAHWVSPEIVVEVSFTEWTRDGRLRHPVYQGLREDKEADEVRREKPRHAPVVRARGGRTAGARAEGGDASIAGVRLSSPDRVVYRDMGVTKREIAEYYVAVAPHILPHLKDRPLSIVRCPEGPGGQCFFQKHMEIERLKGLRTIPIEESKGVRNYVIVSSLEGLISLVQMNCLELHGWGARGSNPDAADRIVFDLDPGPGVEWAQIAGVARRVRDVLAEAGLESFVKTSGGKGIHVVAPLSRRAGWDLVKEFSKALAVRLASESPEEVTATVSKSERSGRVFIDYLRNSRGATSVVAFSTRARAGAGVSMPVAWSEVSKARPERFTLRTALKAIGRRASDPWATFFDVKQGLSARAVALMRA